MLVINLYPFNETVAKENCSFEDAVENIDIGGPAMLRAAAKNHQDVTVLISPEDYAPVLTEMKANKNTVSYKTNLSLAKKYLRIPPSMMGLLPITFLLWVIT